MSVSSRCTRLTYWLVLGLLYAHGASALLHAFMSQWGRQIGESMSAALAHDLPRPFVYRMLTPSLVNTLESVTPKRVQESVLSYQDFLGRPVVEQAAGHYDWGGGSDFSFVALNVFLFLVLYALAFVWRGIAGVSIRPSAFIGRRERVICDFLPMIAFLLLPVTFVRGGYLYDPLDLLMGSLGFLFFLRRRWVPYYVCLAVALFNKESSVLWIGWFGACLAGGKSVSGFRILRLARRDRLGIHVLLHVALGALAILVLYSSYAEKAGSPVQHRFFENLHFWTSGVWLVTVQDSHAAGLPLPASMNVIHLALLAGLWRCVWGRISQRLFFALLGAVACVIPLFIPFGFRDEIRVFGATVIPVLMAMAGDFLGGDERAWR